MAAYDEPISPARFRRLLKPVLGLRVSRPWLGYGDVLFLELGRITTELTQFKVRGRRHRTRWGQANAFLDSDWKVETDRDFLFSRSSSARRKAIGLKSLIGRRVIAIRLDGVLPEVRIELDRAIRISSFRLDGVPRWDVGLRDRTLFPRTTFPRWSAWKDVDCDLFVGCDDKGLHLSFCYDDRPATP